MILHVLRCDVSFSNKLPGDADAAVLQTTLRGAGLRGWKLHGGSFGPLVVQLCARVRQ